jgi:hypothetical protein
MRLKEMRFMGLEVWPPQWSSSSHKIDDKAVLMDAKLLVGTDLLRVDVDQNGIPHLGVMLVEKEARASLYRQLKENIGRHLGELAELEIELEPEATDSHAIMG